MRNHLVNDRFWSDSFIEELNSEQKLLFLYLLTCPLNNYLGIFEIGFSTMSFQTGIEKNKIIEYLKLFHKNKKILFYKGWVSINNFKKYNKLNPLTMKNAEEQLRITPKEIIEYFENEKKGLAKDCKRIDEGLSNPSINSNIINSNKLITNELISINDIFNAFYEINPGINFGNKTQRASAEFLLNKFGGEKTLEAIELYKKNMNEKYCPVATTPLAFREKLGDIITYFKKLNNNPLVTDLGEV